MNPLEYLRLQLRLEGKEIVNGNMLRQVEIVPGEDIPLMIIAQLADQDFVFYFDEGLSTEFREELRKEVDRINFSSLDRLITFLKNRNIAFEVGHYKTYIFPEGYPIFKDETVQCYSKHHRKVQTFAFDGFAEHVYGIERDDKIVSACVSIRENDSCGEAWVYTNEDYRHQGLAQKVVNTWAVELITAGKIPFYSHKVDNKPSANLARRLRLEAVFEELVISYANV